MPEAAPRPATLRKRAERARRKAGEVAYRLTVVEYDVVAALIASRRLSEAQALRRALVERELTRVLAEWAARWKDVTL
jgi:hypothetical protein